MTRLYFERRQLIKVLYRQLTILAALASLQLADGGAIAQSGSSNPLMQHLPPGLWSGERRLEVLATQILLDRSRHSPGVIDGIMGQNTLRAIRSYKQQHGLDLADEITPALIAHLRKAQGEELWQRYVITGDDVAGPFRSVPASMTAKARLDTTAYSSPAEKLAEKFHMSLALLRALNPGAKFGQAGTRILAPRSESTELRMAITHIEVDKASNELRAFAPDGRQVATYPVTVGSSVYPSPSDRLEVLAIALNPTYHFDPSGRSWGPGRELTIAPGPNNPVGTVWIDLSRDGFGIHGTPEPRLIGKTESHGCVRLTNWDAEELAEVVSKGTLVEFV